MASKHLMAQLADIGIDESWQEGGMTDEDAIQVLAFHKFLNSGVWKNLSGQKIFMTDKISFAYATGVITAEEYLEQLKMASTIRKHQNSE